MRTQCYSGFVPCDKPLVQFAAQQKHLGFYATPTGHEAFAERRSAYKQGKGSVQFPYSGDRCIPGLRESYQCRN